jgi:hypothetical protein
MREAFKGRKYSEEVKANMRNKIVTDETKQKQSESKLGKKRKPFTEETKEKMRQSQQLRRQILKGL